MSTLAEKTQEVRARLEATSATDESIAVRGAINGFIDQFYGAVLTEKMLNPSRFIVSPDTDSLVKEDFDFIANEIKERGAVTYLTDVLALPVLSVQLVDFANAGAVLRSLLESLYPEVKEMEDEDLVGKGIPPSLLVTVKSTAERYADTESADELEHTLALLGMFGKDSGGQADTIREKLSNLEKISVDVAKNFLIPLFSVDDNAIFEGGDIFKLTASDLTAMREDFIHEAARKEFEQEEMASTITKHLQTEFCIIDADVDLAVGKAN